MRIAIVLAISFLAACNNSSTKKGANESDTSSKNIVVPDGSSSVAKGNTAKVNELVKDLSDGMWHVVNDTESGWTPDVFDYFVKPERAKDPDYPYVASGDFNCDNKPDFAAVVTDSAHKSVYIVFVSETDRKLTVWGEDVKGVAINTLPVSEILGFVGDMEEKKVKLKCNGLQAVWFESSSYVIYWSGNKFENIWTSD